MSHQKPIGWSNAIQKVPLFEGELFFSHGTGIILTNRVRSGPG